MVITKPTVLDIAFLNNGIANNGLSVRSSDIQILGGDVKVVYPAYINSTHISSLNLTGGLSITGTQLISGVSSTSSAIINNNEIAIVGKDSTSIKILDNKGGNITFTTSGTFEASIYSEVPPSTSALVAGTYDNPITIGGIPTPAVTGKGMYTTYIYFSPYGLTSYTTIAFTDFTTLSNVMSVVYNTTMDLVIGNYQSSSTIYINTEPPRQTGLVSNGSPRLFVMLSQGNYNADTSQDLIPRDYSVDTTTLYIVGNSSANSGNNNATFMVFEVNDYNAGLPTYKKTSAVFTSTNYVYGNAIEVDESGIYVAYVFNGTITGSVKDNSGNTFTINQTSGANNDNTLVMKFHKDDEYHTIKYYYVIGGGTNTSFTTTKILANGQDIYLSGATNSGTVDFGSQIKHATSNNTIWVASYPKEF